MRVYVYQAMDGNGKEVESEVTAIDPIEALRQAEDVHGHYVFRWLSVDGQACNDETGEPFAPG